ncbi:hypothetical protein T439DRAFT_76145 [Meredithblackwellia eburnea MCA 4105]
MSFGSHGTSQRGLLPGQLVVEYPSHEVQEFVSREMVRFLGPYKGLYDPEATARDLAIISKEEQRFKVSIEKLTADFTRAILVEALNRFRVRMDVSKILLLSPNFMNSGDAHEMNKKFGKGYDEALFESYRGFNSKHWEFSEECSRFVIDSKWVPEDERTFPEDPYLAVFKFAAKELAGDAGPSKGLDDPATTARRLAVAFRNVYPQGHNVPLEKHICDFEKAILQQALLRYCLSHLDVESEDKKQKAVFVHPEKVLFLNPDFLESTEAKNISSTLKVDLEQGFVPFQNYEDYNNQHWRLSHVRHRWVLKSRWTFEDDHQEPPFYPGPYGSIPHDMMELLSPQHRGQTDVLDRIFKR